MVKCYDFIHRFTKDYAIEQHSLKCLNDFTESVINKRREQLKKSRKASTSTGGIREKKVFLDLILESADTLSYNEIKDEVNTLLFGVLYFIMV
jgi:predicted N-acyltransferase